jgi:uncharacterized DUF497 family protein
LGFRSNIVLKITTELPYNHFMEFEWHHEKNLKNLARHRIDFPYAIQLFGDPSRIEWKDDRKDYGEMRYITIGKIEDIIYTAVYTIRRNTYRLISVRRANKNEKSKYKDQLETG